MSFIICDDHDSSVEAENIDAAQARQLMLTDSKPGASPAEKEIINFGRTHRHCNVRILQS